ncbi:MAG: hypothetical protein MJ102_02555 [Clostridia bacterium]|nr:hypothetical protein [Clostridia bacterium]
MRKTLSVILSVLMILSMICVGAFAAETEAVAITSAEDFAKMDPDGNYYLDADISISASYDADPAADGKTDLEKAKGFKGTFDGKGHTITIDNCPVFANLNGRVLNLVIAGADVNVTDVDFGALAAYTEIGMYAENVTNNVNITATGSGLAVAGLVARSADYGKKCNFVNCTNNGNITGNSSVAPVITAEDPTGSATKDVEFYVAGIAAKVDTAIAHNCVNEGDIKALSLVTVSPLGFAGGLFARVAFKDASNYIDAEYCVNNGDVYGSHHAAGIVAYVGVKGNFADIVYDMPFVVRCCVNNGEITGHHYTGGIVGYAYCTGSKSDEAISVTYCVNTGKINGGRHNNAKGAETDGWISNILSYSNSIYNKISYNIGVGDMSFHGEEGCSAPHFTFLGCSSANYEQDVDIHDNYIVDNGVTEFTTWCADNADHPEYAENNRKDFDWGVTNNYVKRINAADLADGSIAYAINKVEGFNGLNQTIGVDTVPSPLPTSKYVVLDGTTYKNADAPEFKAIEMYDVSTEELAAGETEATSAAPATSEENVESSVPADDTTITPADDSTNAPADETTNAPADETTAPAKDKGCGSVIGCGVAVVALLGAAYVSKKKISD